MNRVCPVDKYKPKLTPCSIETSVGNFSNAQCATGICTSRDIECLIKMPESKWACSSFSNKCTRSCSKGGYRLCDTSIVWKSMEVHL